MSGVVAGAGGNGMTVQTRDDGPGVVQGKGGSHADLADAAEVRKNGEGYHTYRDRFGLWVERLSDVGYPKDQLHRGWAGHRSIERGPVVSEGWPTHP